LPPHLAPSPLLSARPRDSERRGRGGATIGGGGAGEVVVAVGEGEVAMGDGEAAERVGEVDLRRGGERRWRRCLSGGGEKGGGAGWGSM
jgi:hypothetical protein